MKFKLYRLLRKLLWNNYYDCAKGYHSLGISEEDFNKENSKFSSYCWNPSCNFNIKYINGVIEK